MNLNPSKLLFLIALAMATEAFSQTVPKSTGSKTPRDAAQAALDFHNKVRKDVGSPPLTWSTELSKYAQAWADYLAKDKNCKMQHRPQEGKWKQIHGENIFWGSSDEYNATNASESWYSEIKDYKHGPLTDSNWFSTGHYTQMVWKNTTSMGLGQATCANGAIIIVGNYDPAGNYIGQKAY